MKENKPQLYKPGQSGNPKGRPKESKAVKAVRSLTKQEMLKIANFIVKGDVAALKKMRQDTSTVVIQAMIAAVAIKIIGKGDMVALDMLLNRLIGKVKDEVLYSAEGNSPNVIVTLPSNGREVKNEG
jgi:hypothetical protein